MEGFVGTDTFDLTRPMYLATGLGANFIIASAIVENREEYYRSMLEPFPCNSLLLLSFARLLKNEGNYDEAKDYYLRAMAVEPQNGEVVTEFAEMVCELHGHEKAVEVFESAAEAAQQDSGVLAAYAGFLW